MSVCLFLPLAVQYRTSTFHFRGAPIFIERTLHNQCMYVLGNLIQSADSDAALGLTATLKVPVCFETQSLLR